MRTGIVTSSDWNPYGAVIIERLKEQGDLPVCVISNEKTRARKLAQRAMKGEFGAILRDAGYMLGRPRPSGGAAGPSSLEEYAASRGYGGADGKLSRIASREGIAVGRFRDFNGSEAVGFIEEHRVDVLINAGHGIFRKWIIAAPRIGILNAHMGILPAYRGMNVIEWSAFYGDPIGVTVHLIDRGIDTGDILMTREVRPRQGDDFQTLRGRIRVAGIELLAETVTLLKEDRLLGRVQAPEEGKQYFVMHPRLAAVALRRLRSSVPG